MLTHLFWCSSCLVTADMLVPLPREAHHLTPAQQMKQMKQFLIYGATGFTGNLTARIRQR